MTLDLTAKSFSLANAVALAQYAKRAYSEATISDAKTDTQVLVSELDDCVIVSPRGTSDLRDFITDAEAWKIFVPRFGAKLHAGLFHAWSGINSALVSYLEPLRAKPILIGGHSLGGMLAFPIAKSLRTDLFNVHSVYNLGAPRPADKTFQGLYNCTPMPGSPFATLGEATFTLIHNIDIVPRLPFYTANYHRPGLDEFISFTGGITEEPSVLSRLYSDIEALGVAWYARRNPTFVDGLITDHRIDNYIAALAALAPKPMEVAA